MADNKKLREEIREKYDIPDIKKLVNKMLSKGN